MGEVGFLSVVCFTCFCRWREFLDGEWNSLRKRRQGRKDRRQLPVLSFKFRSCGTDKEICVSFPCAQVCAAVFLASAKGPLGSALNKVI